MIKENDILIVARNKKDEKKDTDNIIGSDEEYEVVEKPFPYLLGNDTIIILRVKRFTK